MSRARGTIRGNFDTKVSEDQTSNPSVTGQSWSHVHRKYSCMNLTVGWCVNRSFQWEMWDFYPIMHIWPADTKNSNLQKVLKVTKVVLAFRMHHLLKPRGFLHLLSSSRRHVTSFLYTAMLAGKGAVKMNDTYMSAFVDPYLTLLVLYANTGWDSCLKTAKEPREKHEEQQVGMIGA